jgi:hypothetical protein
MKNLLFLVFAIISVIGCNNQSTEAPERSVLRIHQGQFAFCGASSAVPTGRKIIIQGKEFEEGCAICPVLNGPSISNLAMFGEGGTWGKFNVENSFQTPDGTENTVWSLFWYYDSTTQIPQFNTESKSWELMAPKNRAFTIDMSNPTTSESNMFAMPGVIIDTTETGIILAKVYGPLNEDALPLRIALPVKNGETSVTAAKIGAPYPVGTPIPTKEK